MGGLKILQVGQIFHRRQVGKEACVVAQVRLQTVQLVAKHFPVGVGEGPGGHPPVPLRGEGPHLLVQDDDGDPREIDAVAPVTLDGLTGQGEEVVNALQRGRLLALSGQSRRWVLTRVISST